MKYYICMNRYMNDEEFEGDLYDAMKAADEMSCYNQQDIKIFADGERQNLVAIRPWCGCTPDDDCGSDIISYGDFGYYGEWNAL